MMARHGHSSCVNCPRRALTEWSQLAPEELELIDRHKRDQIYQPGQVLYNQGDSCEGIYCVKEGLVGERRVDADGHSALVRLSHPGMTVGYQELLSRSDYQNSAEILQESHVCFIAKSAVRRWLQDTPALGERFLRRNLQDVRELQTALVEARTLGVKTRLLHLLLVFYERNGRHDAASGHVFDIPVARQDLAALVGTSPETISRTIRKLEEEEIVYFQGNTAAIPNLDMVFQQIA
jgi:CRP/FNR family transcriptional regulator